MNLAPSDCTCSFVAGRTSVAVTCAPRRLAVAIACKPATPTPMMKALVTPVTSDQRRLLLWAQ